MEPPDLVQDLNLDVLEGTLYWTAQARVSEHTHTQAEHTSLTCSSLARHQATSFEESRTVSQFIFMVSGLNLQLVSLRLYLNTGL